jgi:Flp pilus assembly pilin Flp
VSTLVLRFMKDEAGAIGIGGGLAATVVAIAFMAVVQALGAKLCTLPVCANGVLGYVNAYRLAWDMSGAQLGRHGQQHERYYVSDPVSSATLCWERSNAVSLLELTKHLFAIG